MSLDGQQPPTPPPGPAPEPALTPAVEPPLTAAVEPLPTAPPPATPAPVAPPTAPPPTAPRLTAASDQFPVELVHARRSFGDVVAVQDVSFQVPAGTILGVIGPSGSGKTTTIRLILGTLGLDAGQARVLGEDPRRFRRRTRERIGYQPQSFVMYPDLTARENVNFIAATFGLLWRKRRRRVREVMELVGLWERRDRRAGDMSGGEQRRLELCCALVHEPSLLVLDEPTAGVDPLLRQTIWDELERLRDAGVTIIVTTQYVTEAEYCDSVALISSGEVVAHASPDDVRRQALGGELVEVVTTLPLDARQLPAMEDVLEIRQISPVQLLIVAEDAARATPKVVDAITEAGGEVETTQEVRPSFDEVFATLVNRHDEMLVARNGTPANGQAA
jgi:ABC-2 type transport system ATP-binding protein